MTHPAMTSLVLLRHGPTLWNEEKRLQGRSDVPLSEAGREAVSRWRLPDDLAGYRWLVSPLGRARETADLLGVPAPEVEPLLIEMSWGAWEGRRLPILRLEEGDAMAREEARGLDMQPPEGESPRQVQERLKPLLKRLAQEAKPSAAVCHRGVIRAIYALANGWDMTGKPPQKIKSGCLHRFLLDLEGRPSIQSLNEPLEPRP
ncbi:histidine phosphatase family protein [Limibacillus halophilus]